MFCRSLFNRCLSVDRASSYFRPSGCNSSRCKISLAIPGSWLANSTSQFLLPVLTFSLVPLLPYSMSLSGGISSTRGATDILRHILVTGFTVWEMDSLLSNRPKT